jgi:hypothetical protein
MKFYNNVIELTYYNAMIDEIGIQLFPERLLNSFLMFSRMKYIVILELDFLKD